MPSRVGVQLMVLLQYEQQSPSISFDNRRLQTVAFRASNRCAVPVEITSPPGNAAVEGFGSCNVHVL